jgi:hypothetical protein
MAHFKSYVVIFYQCPPNPLNPYLVNKALEFQGSLALFVKTIFSYN